MEDKIMAIESSDKKVKEICDLLYKETILPAKEESEQRIEDAKRHAAAIIAAAKEEAKVLLEENQKNIQALRKIHEAAEQLAITRAIEVLKAGVMNLFHKDLLASFKSTLSEKEVCKNILEVLLEAIKRDGIKSDLRLEVSSRVDFDQLVSSMVGSFVVKLEKGDIPIQSGVALTLKDKKITLKVTEETIKELLASNLPLILKSKVFS
jgi:hypothetical protein